MLAVSFLIAGLLLMMANVAAGAPAAPARSSWRGGDATVDPVLRALVDNGVILPPTDVEPVPGGLSNRNYHIFDAATGAAGGSILRVPGDANAAPGRDYTATHLVNRDLEAHYAAAAGDAGTSPRMLFYAPPRPLPPSSAPTGTGDQRLALMSKRSVPHAVMLTEWLPRAHPLSPAAFRGSLAAVGGTVRRYHESVVPHGYAPNLFSAWERAANYLARAESLGVRLPDALNASVPTTEGQPLGPLGTDLTSLAAATDKALRAVHLAEDELAADHVSHIQPLGTVPLHCDLNPGNLLWQPLGGAAEESGAGAQRRVPPTGYANADGFVEVPEDSEKCASPHAATPGRLWVVDFEYGHQGDAMWDIANMILFNELSDAEALALYQGYAPRHRLSASSEGDDELSRALGPTASAKLRLMKWLYGLSEGLWGLTHDRVSDLPFDAAWTAPGVASFRDYGLRFLDAAVAESRTPEFQAAFRELQRAAAAYQADGEL